MGIWLDLVFGLLSAVPSGVGLAVRARGRTRRSPLEAPPAAWAAAITLLLSTTPLLLIAYRAATLALRSLDDDLMWFLGLILFLPLAAMAVALVAIATATAAVAAHGLVADAEHGRAVFLTAAGCAVVVGLFVAASGLPRHGLVTAGFAFLAAGAAGGERANA